MSDLLHDLRYTLRQLARSPGFTAVAVASLALGIGANAAIFTLLDRALLRPLPVDAPERLVILSTMREDGRRNVYFSYPAYRDYAERDNLFAGLIALSNTSLTLTTGTAATRVDASMVSPEYFDMLGVEPALGSGFQGDGFRAPVAVLSHALWRRRFSEDPSVLGRTLALDGHPFTIIGVAPEGFRGLRRGRSPDLWLPLGAKETLTPGPPWFSSERNLVWLRVAGRLAPGITRERAQDAASVVFEHAGRPGERAIILDPGARGYGAALSDYAKPLAVLMGVVALVLLIACANVANLLLARASVRRREIGIRLSLGASRGRLVRQLLTESSVLALLGAAAGLLISTWTADLLLGFRPVFGDALAFDTSPDARVLAFALAASLVTVLVSGLVPALRASRPDVVSTLKDGRARPGGLRRRLGLRGALAASQVALALVLLTGAGLLAGSLANLRSADLGFSGRNLLLARFGLGEDYDDAAGIALYERLLRRVEAIPGVRSASLAGAITPAPALSSWGGLEPEGYPFEPDESVTSDVNVVGPDYFETLGMPIVHGRGFDARDREGAPRVAVVNETFAKRYWPDGDAVGMRIGLPVGGKVTVVGVAKAGRYRGVRNGDGTIMYLPILQLYRPSTSLLVRGDVDASSLTAPVRRELRALDPGIPVFNVRTMDQHLDRVLSRDRLVATLAVLFGVLALALAAVGVYGVMAYFAAQRTREIGIRIALGARRADVLRVILGRGAALLGVGLAAGLVAALAVTRVLGGLLFHVSPTDAMTLSGTAALLGAVGLITIYIPARRATGVDPMIALRGE